MRSWKLHADEVDEAVDLLRRDFGEHTQIALGPGSLRFALFAAAGLRVLSGGWSTRTGQSLRASASVPVLHLPRVTGAEYRVGRRRMYPSPRSAVVLAPGHEYTRLTPPGGTQAVWLDPELLDEAIELRIGGRTRGLRLDSVEMSLSGDELVELGSLIRYHRELVESLVQGAGRDEDLERIERRLAGWLAGKLLDCQGMRASSTASALAAEEIEDWIRSHLAESITLDRLAAVAGLTGRALQKACLSRWGLSPLELVASRRLDAVRSRLLSGGPGLTVTRVATECGFTHLGRFTGLYRLAFGENPSQTLSRSRRS